MLLYKFRQKEGHCNVRADTPELGGWVARQRTNYLKIQKEGATDEQQYRINLLNSIGFKWKVVDRKARWESRFRELEAFKNQNGHTNVPREAAGLGRWGNGQREAYSKKTMCPKRVVRLIRLGFRFAEPRQTTGT